MKLNWRTALILEELELEIEAQAAGRQHRQQLKVSEGRRRGRVMGWRRAPLPGTTPCCGVWACGLAGAVWTRFVWTWSAGILATTTFSEPPLLLACLLLPGPQHPHLPSELPSFLPVYVCACACALIHLHRRQELLNKKDAVGDVFNQLRLARQRGLNQAHGTVGVGLRMRMSVCKRRLCIPPALLLPTPACLRGCASCLPARLPACRCVWALGSGGRVRWLCSWATSRR